MLVAKVITSKNPKMSYQVGNDAQFLPVLQFLSHSIFESGVNKKFKLL